MIATLALIIAAALIANSVGDPQTFSWVTAFLNFASIVSCFLLVILVVQKRPKDPDIVDWSKIRSAGRWRYVRDRVVPYIPYLMIGSGIGLFVDDSSTWTCRLVIMLTVFFVLTFGFILIAISIWKHNEERYILNGSKKERW